MAELSPDEKSIIKDYPLAGSLDNLCGLLQEAETIYSSDTAIDSLDQLYRSALSKLLHALQGGDAAFNLRSRIADQNAADTDIWKAVYDLIATAFRETPPASVLPSFDATPVRFTSSSQKGTEQTRQLVEGRIFEEICGCTFQDVEGFFTKYFEGKDWSVRADAIRQRVLEPGSNSEWARFPDPPVQNAVLDWWLRFQDNFLSNARGVYFSTASKLKKSSDEIWTKSMLLQLAHYVQEVFITQPACQFVHAFMVCGTNMEAWMFNHSGPYSSGVFDVYKNAACFFQMVLGYAMMSDEELGLDTFTTPDGNGS
ncbi:hypothetical protein CIRG_02374 [Coccidioides immitis RMSCC 2394]|uniref:Fungal-type protein kinase domain-containing protein n=1 Tax=Coccidioides immitis RMSCC 2394 TaxID=404692 RepID=A0A0J7AYX8_COCIT|nr:hypothetical protein CIRG_02374 [Coccidioides immitis RMSCC 2394]